MVRTRIAFGGIERQDQQVAVADAIAPVAAAAGIELDGVLGADALAGMRVTIDYPRKMMWLER